MAKIVLPRCGWRSHRRRDEGVIAGGRYARPPPDGTQLAAARESLEHHPHLHEREARAQAAAHASAEEIQM